MQPYLFPYFGYFQLIKSVDAFVVYDDVNYINKGWINRNNILSQGRAHLFTMGLKGASQNKLINEIDILGRNEKLVKLIQQSYSKAKYFNEVFPIIQDVMFQENANLANFLMYGLRKVSDYIGLKPKWIFSSQITKDVDLRGQEKILAICEKMGAKQYINMNGGRDLYDRTIFQSRGIELQFLQPRHIEYVQFGNTFVPNLSILDVLMFNSISQVNDFLFDIDLS